LTTLWTVSLDLDRESPTRLIYSADAEGNICSTFETQYRGPHAARGRPVGYPCLTAWGLIVVHTELKLFIEQGTARL
jgi:hypothetical protein